MATEIVRPNSDNGTNQWNTLGGSGGHYTRVDDNSTQPAGSGDGQSVYSGGVNLIEDFKMGNVVWDGTVSNVTIWIYAKDNKGGGNEISTDLYIGGAWQGLSLTMPPSNESFAWYSESFNGNWNQDDVNAMVCRAKITASGDAAGFIEVMYAVITYELPVATDSSTFFGTNL